MLGVATPGLQGRMCFLVLEAEFKRMGLSGDSKGVPRMDESQVFHSDLLSPLGMEIE